MQKLGANQAVKSREIDLNADREPTVVDIEDYDGDDFDENDGNDHNTFTNSVAFEEM